MATMRDVSLAAGVSVATVSRVIAGSPLVEQSTRDRVLASIEALDYRPNLVARGLRRQASQVLALIITDVENPFYTSVCRGVEDMAREHGYSVILCNADRDIAKEREYLRVVADQNASGVILSPASATLTDVKILSDRGIPVIAVDMALAGASGSVLVDNVAAASRATAHLLEGGARRVACITGPSDNATATDRLEGYFQALRAVGRTPDPDLYIYSDYREEGGFESVNALLDSAEPPDAIFVTNNRMVVGALRALQARGVRIPEEVDVMGFDELPWALQLHPGLSTIRQPGYQIGQQAARLLIEKLTLDTEPGHLILDAELILPGPDGAARQVSV